MNGDGNSGEEQEHPHAEPRGRPQISVLVLPPSHPAEETERQEGVVAYEAPPPPESSFLAKNKDMRPTMDVNTLSCSLHNEEYSNT